MMFFQGGNIPFTVQGDTEFNLDEVDFKVLLYPDRHPESATTIEKYAMTKAGENTYSYSIGYAQTKTMPIGKYTIEVLIIANSSTRSIFMNQSCFALLSSASKNIG